jgi:hypothetical protein
VTDITRGGLGKCYLQEGLFVCRCLCMCCSGLCDHTASHEVDPKHNTPTGTECARRRNPVEKSFMHEIE